MLDNMIVDIRYQAFKELYNLRQYPLYCAEEAEAFDLVMIERHRAYRCVIIKEGYEKGFTTELELQEIASIRQDFFQPGSLKSLAKPVANLTEAIALGINQCTYKYTSVISQSLYNEGTEVYFQGKCKTLRIESDADLTVTINSADPILCQAEKTLVLDFGYKLVNPTFKFVPNDLSAEITYFIDGETM